MAYSSFYKNRFSAYRRARSSRRWASSSRRRAWGNSRAARQQRDATTVTISRIASIPVIVSAGNSNGATAINHWNSLRLSTYFGNYAPMYDQMKIDKIKVKITGSQSASATSTVSPSVICAFDRNGLSSDQSASSASISTYSSAQLKQWSTGNAFVMWQTIYPSTIMEKGQYVPTDSLLAPAGANNVPTNPCNDFAAPTLPFKPITLLAVDVGLAVEQQNSFVFTVEFEYTVTFRGMRKPSVA